MLIVLLIAQAGYEEMSLEELMNIRVEAVSRYEETIREAPASVAVVTREEIELLGLRTLAEVLDYAISTFASTDRTYQFASSRGFLFPEDWNTRFLVLVDEHILNEAWNSYAPIGDDLPIPVEAIERVEVIRGPGSSVYGTNAFFGVINVVTRKEGASLGLAGSYPKRGTETRGFGEQNLGPFRFWAAGSLADIRYPDMNLPEEIVDYPVDYDGDTVYGGLARDVDYARRYYALFGARIWDLDINMCAYQRIAGTPYADYGAVYGEKDNRLADTRQYIDILYRAGFGAWSMAVQGYWDHYLYQDSYHYADPDSSDYGVGPGYIMPWRGEPFWWGTDARISYKSPNLSLLVGFAYQHRKVYQSVWVEGLEGDTIEELSLTYPLLYQDILAPYGEAGITSNLGKASFGMRYDRYSSYGGIIAPRFGLVAYLPGASALKLIYGKAFRAPSVLEAFFEDSLSLIANPDLKPEIIEDAEAQLIWAKGNILVNLGCFYDFIYNGIEETIDSSGLGLYQNLGVFRGYGAEGEATLTLGIVRPFVSFTIPVIESRTAESWERMNFTPYWLGKAGLMLKKNNASVSAWAIFVGPRLDRNDSELSPQFRLNANCSWRWNFGLITRFSIRNLTDSPYRHPLVDRFVPIFTEDRGRSVTIELFLEH
ncbi:MAG: TonB-dependent receptor [candidate division WOR-3 bacterium]